ncbi:hypothetical protein P43SY_005639 [Pythium insidiosum]|uniref:MYND-type domain-containing protein n=1 Tax=Pythium insidiosum TaxID=114742 RepID=A0AAD5LDR8_PYTIN|nr:hypothetical protein P43SY_005639 [Pythium insidiosum]
MAPGRKAVKRKAGHIGFQSNEIAYIEDEMAALAAEYGLDVDNDVAANVSRRKDAKKKARLHRRDAQPDAPAQRSRATELKQPPSTPPPRVQLAPLPRARVVERSELGSAEDAADRVGRVLRDVLPAGVVLGVCAVPGCSCRVKPHRRNNATLSADKAETVASEGDLVRRATCPGCHHGVLQHTLVEDPAAAEGESKKPSGGQRLFSVLFEHVRVARLAGALFRSRVWVAAALALLDALLQHLRKQFSAGGSHNGQKTILELRQEQYVLTELTALHKKADKVSQKALSRDALPIALACVFDDMYFHCYYACIVLYGRACAAVPAPEDYFHDLESFAPEVLPQLEAFVHQELVGEREAPEASAVLASLALPRKGERPSRHALALLQIYHARLREGVRLFYEASVGLQGEMDALLSNPGGVLAGASAAGSAGAASSEGKTKKSKSKRRDDEPTAKKKKKDPQLVEMPAFELLAQWRNNCRDWCCHLYAYATPTDAALDVIAKYAPLVEMGAGTGYWSAMLQQRGVDIAAFDACPPSAEAGAAPEPSALRPNAHGSAKATAAAAARNAYHGHVPTFCSVAKGGPEVLGSEASLANRALLLCYPPPHDDMAARCLEEFQGRHVLHIGEWQGDTADRAFEAALETRFELVEQLELPNWGNSAYSLSVWRRRRRRSHRERSRVARLSCFGCAASLFDDDTGDADDGDDNDGGGGSSSQRSALRRCVFCKTHVYCSAACEADGRRQHAAEHAMRLVFFERDDRVEFANELHYKPLERLALGAAGEEDESDDDEESESEDEQQQKMTSKTPAQWQAAAGATPPSKGAFAFNFDA